MLQITAKIDGMMCGMCEAHIKDAVRQAAAETGFPRNALYDAILKNG